MDRTAACVRVPSSLLERRFEKLIWRFRLISIVPVLLSLLGSVGCFAVGAAEVLAAFGEAMTLPFSDHGLASHSIAQMVGGVDYFVIGIALLIFGYGIYELVISDLDPRHNGDKEQHNNLLSVNSLESLKHNLTNVIVVALIVAAFEKMIGFSVSNAADLLALCGCVALMAVSAWLIVRSHSDGTQTNQSLQSRSGTRTGPRTRSV